MSDNSPKTIKWTNKGGKPVETNATDASIEAAEAAGWKRAGAAKPKGAAKADGK